jgi:antitoxin MazE
VAREANLHADQRVRVSIEAGRVIITPIADAPLTLAQRLARFDPVRHGGEVMLSRSQGAEQW